jgi:pyrroloquinoline quinone biosynthesis protein B
LRIIVLGSAAGGGFPQWNCNCGNCRRARAGHPLARPRTQCSLAVSADGTRWCLLNAAPDLRQQIEATPALQPRRGLRHSPIEDVVLTGAEVDQIAGLLSLRERQPLRLHGTRRLLAVLDQNPVFEVLSRELVERRPVAPGEAVRLAGGLSIELFAVPGKIPLYLENEAPEGGETVGVRVEGGGRSFFFVPGCAEVSTDLAHRLAGAELVLFDGTLYQDDEMLRTGTGTKTGRRMGHISVAGPEGSLAAFASLPVGRRIYIHINNTNPILLDDSPEREVVTAAGWEVAYDGMEIRLPCA